MRPSSDFKIARDSPTETVCPRSASPRRPGATRRQRSLRGVVLVQKYSSFALAICFLVFGLPGEAAAREIILENAHFKYVIDASATNTALIHKKTGKNYVAAPGVPFATIKLNGKDLGPTSCTADRNKITIRFESGATAAVRYRIEKSYCVFELESVSDTAVDEVFFLNLPLTRFPDFSGISGLAADNDFSLVVRALDLKTETRVGGLLQAVFSRRHGFAAAKFALVGSPVANVRDELKDLIQRERLPQSPLGGPWALDAPENRGSYLFADVTEAGIDDWISLARKMGVAQIHFMNRQKSMGHYEPDPNRFPHGIAGVKAAVGKIHAAGLRAGIHTLSGSISANDPWVTPVPDKRLARDARLTLAADLGTSNSTVPTRQKPQNLDVVWTYYGNGNVIRIDDELIQYEALDQQAPYGFGKCKRGAFGTKPAHHKSGAPVDHLYVRYECFQPDENSTLVDEVAGAIAGVYNTCGFDMIYMDCAEAMPGDWHGVGVMREAIFRRLKGRALVEASQWGHHSWNFHSRLNAWDFPNWGLKRFIDEHCRSGEKFKRTALLPSQLGWWAILGPEEDHPGEFPDELEYLCAKSLGWDQPLSFISIEPGKNPPNARQDEYLEMIGRYERLRLSNAVSPALREKLRKPKTDFHMVAGGEDEWVFTPADYASHKATGLDDGSSSWTVVNSFAEQPLKVRIESLYAAGSYDSTVTLVLADFVNTGANRQLSAAPGVTASFEAGPASARYDAYNKSDSRSGAWSQVTIPFSPEVDMSGHGALGVWIHGDGRGELLNFQLTQLPPYSPIRDEHYVEINFTGWRYVELLLRERDADRYADYVWPYEGVYQIYREPLDKRHVGALNIFYNNLPPGERVSCLIRPVKALPVHKAAIPHPTIKLNRVPIAFPVTMPGGSYIELAADGACKLYDERGALLKQLRLPAAIPLLKSGNNHLEFSCANTGNRSRAKITLISYGEPLH